MTALAWRFIQPHIGASITRVYASSQLVLITVQAINLLLLNPLDEHDIARELPERGLSRSHRIYHAAKLLTQPRAIATIYQVKNVPLWPVYYKTRGAGAKGQGAIATSRGRFLRRQLAIFVWQYLALDVLQSAARQKALDALEAGGGRSGFTHIDWSISPEKWIERGIQNLIIWFVVSRLVIDSHYRIVSIILVGVGLDVPDNCPPAFGRMADAYTIRKFWG
jgi:hypothetical protein